MKLFKKKGKKDSLTALIAAQKESLKECQKVVEMYSTIENIKVEVNKEVLHMPNNELLDITT